MLAKMIVTVITVVYILLNWISLCIVSAGMGMRDAGVSLPWLLLFFCIFAVISWSVFGAAFVGSQLWHIERWELRARPRVGTQVFTFTIIFVGMLAVVETVLAAGWVWLTLKYGWVLLEPGAVGLTRARIWCATSFALILISSLLPVSAAYAHLLAAPAQPAESGLLGPAAGTASTGKRYRRP
jgi:hypothetical protein